MHWKKALKPWQYESQMADYRFTCVERQVINYLGHRIGILRSLDCLVCPIHPHMTPEVVLHQLRAVSEWLYLITGLKFVDFNLRCVKSLLFVGTEPQFTEPFGWQYSFDDSNFVIEASPMQTSPWTLFSARKMISCIHLPTSVRVTSSWYLGNNLIDVLRGS